MNLQIPKAWVDVAKTHADMEGGTVDDVLRYILQDGLRAHTDRLFPQGSERTELMKKLEQ